jgi:hypothetical protein
MALVIELHLHHLDQQQHLKLRNFSSENNTYNKKLLVAKIKSSIFRAKKPGESNELTNATIPDRDSKPYEGLNP